MKSTRLLPALLLLMFMVTMTMNAQSLTEAKDLLEAGECEDAAEMLREIVASKPKDADASYTLGLAYMCMGNLNEASSEFINAKKKGSRDAVYRLAEISLNRYETDEAENYIEEYRKLLKKAKKGTPDLSEGFDDRLERITSMLDRVEKIVIIDSICVDVDNFFRYYDIAKETGSLSSPDVLPAVTSAASPTVVFQSGDNRERIWAAQNDDYSFELVSAGPTYAGNWSEPTVLSSVLGQGGDANYPFLMSDGITLYFANDGENSIGGYDIFLTRRDGETFLEPTNIGFPYNSPADDYLLAIDEINNLGWWATKRNAPQDSIVIYKFIPNETRENYSYDDPERIARARIDNYRDTWDGHDYTALNKKIQQSEKNEVTVQFKLNIPGRGIYTNLNDFRNKKARNLMQQYLTAENQLNEKEQRLEKLRLNYKINRSKGATEQITLLENDVDSQRTQLKKLLNEVITSEK